MLRGKLSLRSAVATRSTDNILAIACGCIGGTAAAAHTTATAVILDAGLCGIYKNRSAGNIDTAISVTALDLKYCRILSGAATECTVVNVEIIPDQIDP